MDAHKRFALRCRFTFYQRQMHFVGSFVGVGVQRKGAVTVGQFARTGASHQGFVLAAVMDQIGNRANLQTMFCSKFTQLR